MNISKSKNFFQKFDYLYSPLTSCKKSEKSLEPFLRKLRSQPSNQPTNYYQQHRFCRTSLTPVQKAARKIFQRCSPDGKLYKKEKDVIRQSHHNLDQTNFFEEKLKFDKSMENQSLCFPNLMKMFENPLLFVNSTWQCLWKEDLASLNEFFKYFFTLDLQNYAQYSPDYLLQMYDLQSKDPETWNFFLDGNLSVSKSLVIYCSIGVDHALEQEYKTMKIQSGIKGIGNDESALEGHFLISREISQISKAFLKFLNFNSDRINREDHYQLTGETNKRITEVV